MDIEYTELTNGNGFCARLNGRQIGEIDIIAVGRDRLIIESTKIEPEY